MNYWIIATIVVLILVVFASLSPSIMGHLAENLGGGGRGGGGGGRGGGGGGRGGGGGGRGGGGGGRGGGRGGGGGGRGGGRGGWGGGGRGWWGRGGRGWWGGGGGGWGGGWWPYWGWDWGWDYPTSYYDVDDSWIEPVIQRFSVKIGPKSDINPYLNQGSNLGYMITQGAGLQSCGTSGARIDLQYGQTYDFDIYTGTDCLTGKSVNQPFFFTTDPNGGSANGNLFNTTPTVNGTIRITVTRDIPPQFYYQSTNGKNVGGPVYVHA